MLPEQNMALKINTNIRTWDWRGRKSTIFNIDLFDSDT